jgi:carbonic anhydrase
VLTVILEVSMEGDIAFIPIIEVLPLVVDYDTSVVMNHRSILLDNLPPTIQTYFYRYDGFLTALPCSETVTWIIFGNCVKISDIMVNKI